MNTLDGDDVLASNVMSVSFIVSNLSRTLSRNQGAGGAEASKLAQVREIHMI